MYQSLVHQIQDDNKLLKKLKQDLKKLLSRINTDQKCLIRLKISIYTI